MELNYSAERELVIHFPGKLVISKGALSNLAEDVAGLRCSRVMIMTVEPLLAKIQPVIDELAANSVSVITDTSIAQEPGFNDFEVMLKKAIQFKPDVVIGIGGGSVLDVAKLIAAQTNNEQSLKEIVGNGLLSGRKIKLICIPTTAGTGSEASPNAILVDNEDNQKKGIISPYLVPDIVYVDPLLTMSVPPQVTAATGLDALTHCLEAYTNKFAHPFIDIYAFEGMRLIAANIVQAVQNGSDEHARTQVAIGSLLGGFCLGPVNTAGVHALSYPLGSMYHLAHGLSNALLLPYVMEFNMQASPGRHAQVALALGCQPAQNDTETAQKGIEKIKSIIKKCGIPARLRDVGIDEQDIPDIAADALKITRLLKNNPREITLDDAIAIYKSAY
jgi:alcohol dehydrogenase class IV